jgi:hypothetical protein
MIVCYREVVKNLEVIVVVAATVIAVAVAVNDDAVL